MRGIDVLTEVGAPDPAGAGKLVEAMLACGVILLSGGVEQNVLSFTPPFVISEAEMFYALGQLAEAQFALQ
jgi:4-aminobutyrate aminotransferase-like enzyme